MKRYICLFLLIFMFSGCSADSSIDPAMNLRDRLIKSDGCSFTADITADYGDELIKFKIDCLFDKQGNMTFSVIEPETIENIEGRVDVNGGAVTFDGSVLAFPVLADDLITPVSSPWFIIHTLRSGYLVACGKYKNGYQIKLDDSFTDHMIRVDLWTDENMNINSGEVLWDGKRIITLQVSRFSFL